MNSGAHVGNTRAVVVFAEWQDHWFFIRTSWQHRGDLIEPTDHLGRQRPLLDCGDTGRRDYYLYVDEFQNFTTGSFATILSEARKYRLNLTVAHQYLHQLDARTTDAVFGNVGSLVAFQVGSDDAETLAEQFSKHAGQLRAHDLANLPKYTAYARVLVNGLPTAPFSIRTLPPVTKTEDRAAKVRGASRRQFAQPLATVRQHLQQEMAMAC